MVSWPELLDLHLPLLQAFPFPHPFRPILQRHRVPCLQLGYLDPGSLAKHISSFSAKSLLETYSQPQQPMMKSQLDHAQKLGALTAKRFSALPAGAGAAAGA